MVAPEDLHPADDHSHRFFIWPEWIAANGPLTVQSAFEYFTTSMFYDKQSNNQVLRMQTLHTGLPVTNEAEELKRFTGIEFALVHADPPSLFIIQKRERLSPDQVRPLCAYFIVNNRIYQSPDVYSVLSNRLLTAVNSLQSSLDTLRRYRPDFATRTGFVWPIVDDADQTSVKDISKTRASSLLPSATHDNQDGQQQQQQQTNTGTGLPLRKKQENFNLMLNAMRTTAAHSRQAFTNQINEDVPAAEPDRVDAPQRSTPSTATPGAESLGDPASRLNTTSNKRRKKSI